jgi:hypothetical protein
MKNILKNENGQANTIILAIFTAILGFAMLTIGSYVYFAVAGSADAGTQTVISEVKSSGSFAFNGSNFSSEQNSGAGRVTLTITYGSEVYSFDFNTTTVGSPQCHTTNCILVANTNTNNSLGGATNLTARVNANASAAALVTASLSGNTTIITSKLTGTTGDSIVLSKTITPTGQSGWVATSGALVGGRNSITGQSSQTTLNNYVAVTFPLFGLALMILSFAVILFILRKSFGEGR